jgi:hypothetical protein
LLIKSDFSLFFEADLSLVLDRDFDLDFDFDLVLDLFLSFDLPLRDCFGYFFEGGLLSTIVTLGDRSIFNPSS